MGHTLQPMATMLLGLFDYAGLFPPAGLAMEEAARRYARATVGPDAFALGRLVCPVSRLDELTACARALMPGTWATSGYREMADPSEPWRISAIVRIDPEAGEDAAANAVRGDLERIAAFNGRHASEADGLARVDAVEMLAPRPSVIDAVIELVPDDVLPAFEVPASVVMRSRGGGDARGFIAAMAGNDCVAKVRCGGLDAAAFPSIDDLVGFVRACDAAEVPIKATAGLHHPFRGRYPIAPGTSAGDAEMHGFVGLLLAVVAGPSDPDVLADLLSIGGPDRLEVSSEAIVVRSGVSDGMVFSLADLSDAREGGFLSIGSCSIDEPLADLRAAHLVAAAG